MSQEDISAIDGLLISLEESVDGVDEEIDQKLFDDITFTIKDESGEAGTDLRCHETLGDEDIEVVEFQVRVNSDNELDSGTDTEDDSGQLVIEMLEEERNLLAGNYLPKLNNQTNIRVKDEFLLQNTNFYGSNCMENITDSLTIDNLIVNPAEIGVIKENDELVEKKDGYENIKQANYCTLCGQVEVTNLENGNIIQLQCDLTEYKCKSCVYKTNLNKEIAMYKQSNQREFKYSCDLCDFQTKWKNRIKTHKVSVHKMGGLPCKTCDYVASESWVLDQHVRTVHKLKTSAEGDIRYKCTHCDYVASQKSHLTQHIDAMHQKVYYYCDMCTYQTKWKSRLLSHNKAKHMGLFLQCDHCKFKSTERYSLKMHIAKKHGDIKFACFSCNDSCLTRLELKKHMADVHYIEIL